MEITEKLLLIIDVLYILSDLYLAIQEELELLNKKHGPSTGRWQKFGRVVIAFLRGLKGMGSRLLRVFTRKGGRDGTSNHMDEKTGNGSGMAPLMAAT